MVDEVRRGVAWVYKNARRYGGDPKRLYMSAHSSGAHLTANTLLTDWSTLDRPPDTVKAAACVADPTTSSRLPSARSSDVTLDKADVLVLSVTRHVDQIPCPVLAATPKATG